MDIEMLKILYFSYQFYSTLGNVDVKVHTHPFFRKCINDVIDYAMKIRIM